MRFRSTAVAIALASTAPLLVACGSQQGSKADTQPAQTTGPASVFPARVTGSNRYVVDRYSNKLVVYDDSAGREVAVDGRPQTFVYGFPGTASPIFTVGSSVGGDFQVVDLASRSLAPVTTVRDEGAFPLTFDQHRQLFLINAYSKSGTIASSKIAELDGARMRTVVTSDKPVSSAALDGDTLWLTSYDKASGSYELSSLSLRAPSDVRVQSRNLRTGSLFLYQGRPVTDGRFTNRVTEPCDIYCYLDPGPGRLFSLHVRDADLVLDVVNLAHGTRKHVAHGAIVDFAVAGGSVRVRFQDHIQTVGVEG